MGTIWCFDSCKSDQEGQEEQRQADWVLNGCDKAVSTLYDGSNYIPVSSNTSLIHLWQSGVKALWGL